ncbi:hypothetical protein [Bacillus mycoides]|nr:hypothetical protein [Bacillus mycoides]
MRHKNEHILVDEIEYIFVAKINDTESEEIDYIFIAKKDYINVI